MYKKILMAIPFLILVGRGGGIMYLPGPFDNMIMPIFGRFLGL